MSRLLLLSPALCVIIFFIYTQDPHSRSYGSLNATVCVSNVTHCDRPALAETKDNHFLTAQPIFGLVTMAYGEIPKIYDRAVDTHVRHAVRHNYQMHILKRPIAKGYWSKTFFMIGLLVTELSKPPNERLEWFMWFDADTVLINQEIPIHLFTPGFSDDSLDDHLFDDILFVFARDDVGLNSGVFFARVHQTTLHILAKAFSYPIVHHDKDLGHAYDQTSLEKTIREPEYRLHALWMPRHWFNARERLIQPGAMIGHFFDDPKRESDMTEWVLKVEENDPEARIAYENSFYPFEIEEFWRLNRECRLTLGLARHFHVDTDDERDNFQRRLQDMEEVCIWLTDDLPKIHSTTVEMKQTMNILMPTKPGSVGNGHPGVLEPLEMEKR